MSRARRRPGRRECDGDVDQGADDIEPEAEAEDLQRRDRLPAVDELGQEGEEEEGDLGIQDATSIAADLSNRQPDPAGRRPRPAPGLPGRSENAIQSR